MSIIKDNVNYGVEVKIIREGGVDVQPLEVTENGTYTAEEGTAYSPVVVNVQGGGGSVLDNFVTSYLADNRTMELCDLSGFEYTNGNVPFADVNRLKIRANERVWGFSPNGIKHIYVDGDFSVCGESLNSGTYMLIDLPNREAEYHDCLNYNHSLNKIHIKSNQREIRYICNFDWNNDLTEIVIDDANVELIAESFRNYNQLNKIVITAQVAPDLQDAFTLVEDDAFFYPFDLRREIIVPTGATGYDAGAWLDLCNNQGFTLVYSDNPIAYLEENPSNVFVFRGMWEGFHAGQKISFNGENDIDITEDGKSRIVVKMPFTINGTEYRSIRDIRYIELVVNDDDRRPCRIFNLRDIAEINRENPLVYTPEEYDGLTSYDVDFYI